MDAVGVAAVAGAVLGPVVAITAIVAGEYRSRQEREATLELTKGQHEHERALRRGDHYFEKRGEAYESLLALLYDTMRRVELTEPVWAEAGQPEPPGAPKEEAWRWMVVRLSAYGSPEVQAAFDRYVSKVRGFSAAVQTLDAIRRQRGADTAESRAEIGKDREEARTARAEVEELVRADLVRAVNLTSSAGSPRVVKVA